MQEVKTKKEPKIIQLSPEEYKKLKEKLLLAIKEDNDDEIDAIGKIYPIHAEYLNAIKETHGIEHLIENEYNLYPAIEKYGMSWLER